MTNNPNNDMVDAMVYAFTSINEHKQLEGYIQLHIKKRPWWMPKFLYQKLLNLLFEMSKFKKY